MYVDENEKKRTIERIQSFLKESDLIGLKTTAMPADKFDVVMQWNDQVVAWLRDFYGNGSLRHPFECEIQRALIAGERHFVLEKHLKKLLGRIDSDGDKLFRRRNAGELAKLVGMM